MDLSNAGNVRGRFRCIGVAHASQELACVHPGRNELLELGGASSFSECIRVIHALSQRDNGRDDACRFAVSDRDDPAFIPRDVAVHHMCHLGDTFTCEEGRLTSIDGSLPNSGTPEPHELDRPAIESTLNSN
ncbi:hypothetical protein D3C81_1416520 [compost metagenome]